MRWNISPKIKSVFSDTLWSIVGLSLMNIAAQFAVYPYWNRTLGREAYGNIVYSLGIMNVLAISIGSGINYARMRRSAEGTTSNNPYMLLLTAGSILSVFLLVLLKMLGLLHLDISDFFCYCLLTTATLWRFYADVEYRLRINYKGYFFYYFLIGIGYLFGIILFKITKLWPMALLPGEVLGLLYVLWRGSIFRIEREPLEASFSPILRLAVLLVGTNLLSHLIFNGDRIILQLFAGSTAVTIYYIASLFGKTMTLITTPLNSVLVGHLAKYDGKLTIKMMNSVFCISLLVIILATILCVIASWVILPVIYPADFPRVKHYLVLANMAQIIYFIGNVLNTSILLRFTQARNQVIVTTIHAVLFIVISIYATKRFGFTGFCWSLLVINTLRLFICLILGYMGAERELV